MKKLLPALALTLGLHTGVLAQQDVGLLNNDFKVDYYGEVNGNYVQHDDYNYNYTYGWVSLGVEWKNKIRAVLTTSLTAVFEDGDVKFEDGFDIEEFISDAYIEIKEVGGAPVAVIIGKRSIPFGQSVEEMPIFGNNPIGDMYDKDGVFGLTVRLDKGFFGLFDSAEISAFETEGDDLSIGTINGAAVKLSKEVTQNIVASVGAAKLDEETRVTVGLVAKSSDGDLVGWINGMVFSDNPEFPNSDFAITAGSRYSITSSTDVIIEMTYVEKEVVQYALGLDQAITSRFTVGVEVRYNDYQTSQEDEVVFGIRAKYEFGSNGYAPNEEYLFGGED